MMKQQLITKNLIFTAFLFLCCANSSVFAQSESAASPSKESNYLVKVNLLALPLNSYSFQFERAIGKKTALGLGLRYMPKSGIPFKSTIESLINDPQSWNQIKDAKTGNFAFSPEVRFYLGKSVFHGFYVAPFARYTNYTAELPIAFNVPDQTGNTTSEIIPLNGHMTTLTGGLLLGTQLQVTKRFYIDWSILGPQYGISNGAVNGKRSLNSDEQDALKQELLKLQNLPLIKTTYQVDNNGATVDFKGPWAGVRSNLSVGIRF